VLFLDSSHPREVREIFSWGVVAGVTTDPLLITRELGNVDLGDCIKQILAVSTGHVTVELTGETFDQMLGEAQSYHAWDRERVCVGVPFSETGLKVLHRLATQGIPTNVTCMMSFGQMYLAALAGATYLSILSGRVRDMGYDVRPIIREIRAVLDRERLSSKLVVGSIRQAMDVSEALEDGAHIVTVPPPLLRKMLWNPGTDSTIREHDQAWQQRGG
jgi:transaldolase